MLDIGFPIFSIVNHFEKNKFFVAGGGGKEKTGIENQIREIEITEDMEFKVNKKYNFDDSVMNMNIICRKKKIFCASVGSQVKILDENVNLIKEYSAGDASILHVKYCPFKNYIFVIDDCYNLNILNRNNLKVVFTEKIKITNGTVFVDFVEEIDKSYAIIACNEYIIVKDLDSFRDIHVFDDLKGYRVQGLIIEKNKIIASYTIKNKQLPIILEFVLKKNDFELIRSVVPFRKSVISCIAPSRNGFICGTNTGSCVLISREDYRVLSVVKSRFKFPISCIANYKDDINIMGSIGSFVFVANNPPKSVPVFLLTVLVLMFAIVVVLALLFEDDNRRLNIILSRLYKTQENELNDTNADEMEVVVSNDRYVTGQETKR